MSALQLVECPRDAMQGWPHHIPTAQKLQYLQQLLQVGFHTLDCLSFVSAKAIPQMADSHEVARQLDKGNSHTQVLAIVANERGATDALQHRVVDVLGYPFSISPTFQQRNANSSLAESWQRLLRIQELVQQQSRQLVVYLSMAFGNPYADDYSADLVMEWADKMRSIGVPCISLADTVGIASPAEVYEVTRAVKQAFPAMEVGVHLHSTADTHQAKLAAAWQAGCRRFDAALKGIGGCPMAGDALVGNMNTEWVFDFLNEQEVPLDYNRQALQVAAAMAQQIFQ